MAQLLQKLMLGFSFFGMFFLHFVKNGILLNQFLEGLQARHENLKTAIEEIINRPTRWRCQNRR